MHRIICLPPGRQVTLRVPAVGRRDLKAIVAVEVARGTGHVRMAIGQGEVDRRCTMIEVCSRPTIKRVARFAGGCELPADVIRIRSFLIVLQMAGDASRRQALELSDRGALVAILALHCRVSAQERKTILVISYFLDRSIPALDRVTLRAVRTHLSLVNVGVTILTMLADLGE